ncbi:hypothetical protein [Jeotgalicoccus sp. ATCC 8456]|uniref:hypothetical protein n=1 Tax=Jeotgalicoccus sp. ATCC 8456 TaxID=946435 RepID=UPI0018E6270F|nr:hypothetical protein [Jeotgalicoccus sp. ATCC 8456]QQD85663.1 hypothetical protein JEM45_03295 [Jeotgalicoccus sp. ATCC 8456]
MTPNYYDKENQLVTTLESDNLAPLNGFIILNLNDFSTSRIEIAKNKLTDERIERTIFDLLENQYKYFTDKNLTLNFRRNKMNKAILALMYPALVNKVLNLREHDEISIKIAKWLSRDYKMELLDEETEPSTLYMVNTHLMDFDSFIAKEVDEHSNDIVQFKQNMLLDSDELKSRVNAEYNLLNNLRYRNEKKNHLMFDPFNVVAIQERVYDYQDKKKFKPLDRIISILHPSIDFYDFAKGETLMQKYKKVKKKNKNLTEEMKQYKINDPFLREASNNDIKVTDNLDGKILDDGVTFYPARTSISSQDRFEITYKKKNNGMVLIESYFDNPKNSHRIKVEHGGEEFNIDEFLNGKFINVESEVNLVLRYERDYDAPSWQKAGKITIREV